MGRVSQYSREQRRAAVARAFGPDSSPATRHQVAAELGVVVGTLQRWAREPDDQPENVTLDRLLQACVDALMEAGYAELTMAAIAERAGISQRSAFNYFANKQLLFQAAVDRTGHLVSTGIAESINAHADPRWGVERRIREALVSGFDAATSIPHAVILFRDLGVPSSEDATQPWHHRFYVLCRSTLEDPDAQSRLRRGTTPESAARIVVAAGRALIAEYFAGGDRPALRDATGRIPRLVFD